jgi:hypothetical protein
LLVATNFEGHPCGLSLHRVFKCIADGKRRINNGFNDASIT